MKTIIIVIATAAAMVVATYVVSRTKLAALREQVERMQSRQLVLEDEKSRLEKDLKSARNQPARPGSFSKSTELPPVTPPDGRSPQQILEQLKSLKVSAGSNRAAAIRQIIHQLESLVDRGESALPAIREFLAQFEDVDYGSDQPQPSLDAGQEPRRTEPAIPGAGRNQARLDFIFPPSLRLGLVDVLKSIGGPTAESILAEMLSTSGRAVEVAYVARVLQDIAPDKYKETALAAAKDLLANPLSPDTPNVLDENAKSYLYAIMAMYNDPAFSAVAKALLIDAQGQLDRTALTYLATTMKEHAVPALYDAYKDPRVTNMWEKATIAGQALNFAGSNTQADAMFREIVSNESMPSWMRAMTIQTLAGGTFFGGNTPADATQIEGRIALLKSLPEFTDEPMAKARSEAIQRLTDRLEGKFDAGQSGAGHSAVSAPFPGQAGIPQ